jgi:hypothetical protein
MISGAGGRRGGGRLRGLRHVVLGRRAGARGFIQGRDTSVEVHVWGGRELQACVMPHHSGGGGKKQYALCQPLLEREPLPDLALLRRCRVKLSGVAWLFTRTNGWCTPQRRRREHRAGEGQ